MDAGVEQHDPITGCDRPGVAVRYTRPGQRETQAIHAGKDALAPPKLRLALSLGHGRGD
jgi:hypothetical protein